MINDEKLALKPFIKGDYHPIINGWQIPNLSELSNLQDKKKNLFNMIFYSRAYTSPPT